jgi:hypothetical protein
VTWKLLLLIAVLGLTASLLRSWSSRVRARRAATSSSPRHVAVAVGVPDARSGALDVWVDRGAALPARAVRVLRAKPDPKTGAPILLHTDAVSQPRLVRAWLGPFEVARSTLIEVQLTIAVDGSVRLAAWDKTDGRKLTVTRDGDGKTTLPVVARKDAAGTGAGAGSD